MAPGGSTGRPKLIVDALPSRFEDSVPSSGLPRDGVILKPGPL
jgi:hypothetical protein